MGKRPPVAVPAGMRYCFRCTVVQPLGDFYSHARRATGAIVVAAECKSCFNLRAAKHRAAHRTKNAAYARAYRKARPSLWRSRRAKDPAAWLAMAMQANQRHKARKRHAPGAGVTRHQWQDILEEYGHRCAYCARQGKLTMDHVEPLSKGGHHDVANVVPACRECNSSKCDRNILQWLAARAAA